MIVAHDIPIVDFLKASTTANTNFVAQRSAADADTRRVRIIFLAEDIHKSTCYWICCGVAIKVQGYLGEFMRVFNYKRFIGSIEASPEDNCLYGKLLYTNDLVTYEGETVKALESAFQKSVDEYIKTCEKINREPMKPFKGSLNIRIGPELHKEAALQAAILGISTNEYIKKAVKFKIKKDCN